ncbi:MAG: acetolactate decarboxylase [Actinobacteria bacterium]|nr:acetolactate decarboxylase [Actinomycetota bacterium]
MNNQGLRTKNLLILLAFILTFLCLAGTSCGGATEESAEKPDSVFQFSTYGAVEAGLYEGVMAVADLGGHGDFGIGTFDNLDGEMVALDGTIYQVKTDGVPRVPDGDTTSPFAEVTFYETDKSFPVSKIENAESLGNAIDKNIPTKNLIVAIRIPGQFEYIKTRSIPAQNKPYPPLAEAVKSQATFEYTDIKGTIIGFRYPAYMAGINLAGYHFHFISEDSSCGGHLLDCRFKSAKVNIDECMGLELELPDTKGFFNADLGGE